MAMMEGLFGGGLPGMGGGPMNMNGSGTMGGLLDRFAFSRTPGTGGQQGLMGQNQFRMPQGGLMGMLNGTAQPQGLLGMLMGQGGQGGAGGGLGGLLGNLPGMMGEGQLGAAMTPAGGPMGAIGDLPTDLPQINGLMPRIAGK